MDGNDATCTREESEVGATGRAQRTTAPIFQDATPVSPTPRVSTEYETPGEMGLLVAGVNHPDAIIVVEPHKSWVRTSQLKVSLSFPHKTCTVCEGYGA